MQIVLDTFGRKSRACRGVKFCAFTAIAHIDLIDILHKIDRFLFTDVLVQRTTEIVGNIIFAVRKCTCAAKAAHNRTAFAADTRFHFVAVNGTMPFIQSVSCFKDSNFQIGFLRAQFVCGEYTTGTCADNNDIVLHKIPPYIFVPN